MKKLTAILAVTLLMLSYISCTNNDKRVTLKFKYSDGMEINYHQQSKKQTTIYWQDSLVDNKYEDFEAFINQKIDEVINDSTYRISEEDIWKYVVKNEKDSTKLDSVEHSRQMDLIFLDNGKIIDFNIKDPNDKISSTLKDYYEQGMPVFPSKEVYPGYSWTQTTSVVLPNETMNASTTYTIKSFVREMGYDCVVVEYSGTLLIPIDQGKNKSGEKRGVDKIESVGSIYFGYVDGFVIKQVEKWQVSGQRTIFKNDEWINYNFESDYDVVYQLSDVSGK